MIRKTKKNRQTATAKTEDLARHLESGHLDKQDKIAQDIGHRKPYTFERIVPKEKKKQ